MSERDKLRPVRWMAYQNYHDGWFHAWGTEDGELVAVVEHIDGSVETVRAVFVSGFLDRPEPAGGLGFPDRRLSVAP